MWDYIKSFLPLGDATDSQPEQFPAPHKANNELIARCERKVRWVAASFNDFEHFRPLARTASQQLGPDAIETLGTIFHTEHSPPEELADQFPGLGTWIAARQFAIFEILYNLGEPSISLLYRVAYGQYDWTQGNAIEVLCRLAADGIRSKTIIADLKREFPNLRYEAQIYAIRPLLELAETNPSITDVLAQLEDVEEYRELIAELNEDQ